MKYSQIPKHKFEKPKKQKYQPITRTQNKQTPKSHNYETNQKWEI